MNYSVKLLVVADLGSCAIELISYILLYIELLSTALRFPDHSLSISICSASRLDCLRPIMPMWSGYGACSLCQVKQTFLYMALPLLQHTNE